MQIPFSEGGTKYNLGHTDKTYAKIDEGTSNPGYFSLGKFTITYDLNEGNVTDNPTNYSISENTITLKNPSKSGASFSGWQESIKPTYWYNGFINLNTGDFETSNSNYPDAIYSSPITLKANITYKMSYYDNGSCWRIWVTDTNEYLPTMATQTYTPTKNCTIRLLYINKMSETNRNAVTIINQSITKTMTIPKGSKGNKIFTANFTS